MRSHLASNPQDPSGDLGDGDTNFAPTAFGFLPGLGRGSPMAGPPSSSSPPPASTPVAPVLPDESVQAMAAVSGSGSGGTGSVVSETSSSGFTINLVFDSAAMAAPASFRAGIEQAATWSRLAAYLMLVAGPVAALAGAGATPALLALFALILLWLLDDRRHLRLGAACIVLAVYYGAFTSIVVVLPRL